MPATALAYDAGNKAFLFGADQSDLEAAPSFDQAQWPEGEHTQMVRTLGTGRNLGISDHMTRHRFQGAPERFEALADFIAEWYGGSVKYIADVAGGQGMLARLLNKKYNYRCEVVDPRGFVLTGVPSRQVEFVSSMAGYYDLVVGLHPDEATRAVAEAALVRRAIMVPCCNFWSEEKLGRDELVAAIESYYQANSVRFQRIVLEFRGPKNIGILSDPPA